jgi:hypothetical protein
MNSSPSESRHYEQASIEGWDVLTSPLLQGSPTIAQGMRAKLAVGLRAIAADVPAPALAKLRKVKVWLELEDSRDPGGVYHPSRVWLIENGMNPDKEKSVQFAQSFVEWSDHQPMLVLHELAHAYHDQVLTFQYAPIVEAFERAAQSGDYERVERYDKSIVRAYAMKNEREFFAELSEAYFGLNDFFPFNQHDLVKFDPLSAQMVREAWHLP